MDAPLLECSAILETLIFGRGAARPYRYSWKGKVA
jgi:hypothetical protein